MKVLAALISILLTALTAAPAAAALGISVPAATLGGLSPGVTSTSPVMSIVVTGLLTESWSLRVADPTGDGYMKRSAACSLGTATLASRLHLSFSGGLLSTTIDRPEYDLDSATNPVVARGTTPDTFNVQLSQAVGAAELLAAGCSYSVTIQYTVAPG